MFSTATHLKNIHLNFPSEILPKGYPFESLPGTWRLGKYVVVCVHIFLAANMSEKHKKISPYPLVSARISRDDYDVFQKKVDTACLTKSAYLRRAIINNETAIIITKKITADHREMIRYFRATSNNLNQIAHRCNLDNQRGILSEKNYLAILHALENIEHYLAQVI